MAELVAPVGIVGAGPVGLACALRLASFGIRSVVLEAEPALRKQGSKACLIQGDVLEILDKFGCADAVDDEGVTWTVARTYVRGKEIVEKVYPRPLGYGPFVNISQYRVQQLVLEELDESPFTEVLWSHRVSDVEQDASGVTVRVETVYRTRHMRFKYLVACDGVRSDLRDLVGVEWTGYTHADRFLITDIRARLPLAAERHFHYDPPFNPGRQLVMHAQPDDMWRIDWQLPSDADIDEEERTGALDRRIRAVIGDVPYEVDWRSTYRFYQRLVEQMRVGRVFFAGDAAHALPPYGARGMNSGIQDADNLAWKLAYVLDGHADESLLDTYHAERHAAARENLGVTEATIRFMVPAGRARRVLRNLLLRVALRAKPLRRYVNSGRMAEPYVYADSPIVDSSRKHPLLGALAPDPHALDQALVEAVRAAPVDLVGHVADHRPDPPVESARPLLLVDVRVGRELPVDPPHVVRLRVHDELPAGVERRVVVEMALRRQRELGADVGDQEPVGVRVARPLDTDEIPQVAAHAVARDEVLEPQVPRAERRLDPDRHTRRVLLDVRYAVRPQHLCERALL